MLALLDQSLTQDPVAAAAGLAGLVLISLVLLIRTPPGAAMERVRR